MPSEAFSISRITDSTSHLFDPNIPLSEYVPIDLSVENTELTTRLINTSNTLQNYINDYLKKNKASIAFGGYLEQRNIYTRSSHFRSSTLNDQRNIHLGIDFWTNVGTKVLVPIDGRVHSFKNNSEFGDYGPTIILEHHIDHFSFFTLYGHLSLDSIISLEQGKVLRVGECVGKIGGPEVNGDYPPHLHFQVILDMESYSGDYPGVSSKKNLDKFKLNCPDPNLLIKLY